MLGVRSEAGPITHPQRSVCLFPTIFPVSPEFPLQPLPGFTRRSAESGTVTNSTFYDTEGVFRSAMLCAFNTNYCYIAIIFICTHSIY